LKQKGEDMPTNRLKLSMAALLVVAVRGLSLAQPVSGTPAIGESSPKPEGPYLSAYQIKAMQERDFEQRLHYARLVRGNPDKRELALTFDDGPHEATTPRLLDILKQNKVKATFFVVGVMVDRHPELVQREEAEGHEVANHTYHHYRLPGLSQATIRDEIVQGDEAIRRALGASTRLFRPPGGEYDDNVVDAMRQLRTIMVLWTDDPGDYRLSSAQKVANLTRRETEDGAVVLLHDGVESTMEALPQLIKYWKAQGFHFVTCSKMASEPGNVWTGGPSVAIPPHPLLAQPRRHPSLVKIPPLIPRPRGLKIDPSAGKTSKP
jgi:peptidoglycan/xylan/chitin deacetylase (PgdA/CDA1 family)